METVNEKRVLRNWVWAFVVTGVFSLAWWFLAAQRSWPRMVLIVALSAASFMVGCLVGFLFTSYGEEIGTVGKIRDWLVGAISALTVVKASAIRDVLVTFAAGQGPNEYALVTATAVAYSTLGFFFMFYQREMIFNPLLAERRAERGQLEGTREAGQVARQLLADVPVGILSGIEDVDALSQEQRDDLRKNLYSDNTNTFLEQASFALKVGRGDWETVSNAATLHFYRTYIQKDEQSQKDEKLRMEQAKVAACWIDRALVISPAHTDLAVKRAMIASVMKQMDDAIAILETLNRRVEAPIIVRQWLGFYLLSKPDRLDESIRCSESYHTMFPEDSSALFCIAAAYGHKYCQKMRARRQPDPKDREMALFYLRQGLERQPDYAATVRDRWTKPNGRFDCLKDDHEFRSLVGLSNGHSDESGKDVEHEQVASV